MKRLFFWTSIFISLVACNNNPSDSFKLEGFIEGAKDTEHIVLYYYTLKNNELQEITDTAKIINGKFLFEGTINKLTAAELIFDGFDVVISVQLYLEPTSMKLQINKDKPYAYELLGTKVEKENIELRKEIEFEQKAYYEELESMNNIILQMNLHNDNPDSLLNLFNQTKAEYANTRVTLDKKYLDFILKHKSYQIIPDLLNQIVKSVSIPIDSIQNIYNQLPEQSKTSIMGRLAIKQIKDCESEKETAKDIEEDTLIGTFAPSFMRKDFAGRTIQLSDYKSKNYVLLDFWASWCIPCVEKIPQLKDLYNKYNEKGLTIISISLDEDSAGWANTIKKYKLDGWLQVLNVQNKDTLTSLYNVSTVPHFVLIDKQGKIIANPKHGADSLDKIETILEGI